MGTDILFLNHNFNILTFITFLTITVKFV